MYCSEDDHCYPAFDLSFHVDSMGLMIPALKCLLLVMRVIVVFEAEALLIKSLIPVNLLVETMIFVHKMALSWRKTPMNDQN